MPDVPERVLFHTEGPRGLRRRTKVAIIAGLFLIVLAGSAYAYERLSSDHFYPGTTIGDVSVSSRSADEAEALLHDRFVTPLREPLTLTAPQYEKSFTPWKLGMRIDVTEAAREALAKQQSEGFAFRLWHRVTGDDTKIRLRPEVNEKIFGTFMRRLVKRLERSPQDARLDISNDSFTVIPHKLGRTLDKSKAEASILAGLANSQSSVDIPTKTIQPPNFTTDDFRTVILVNTGTNRLRLYKDGKVFKKYGVATGTGGYPTPHGQFEITAKRMNPTWVNPYSDWSRDLPAVIRPGPNNPLGTRALNLSASGIRIHGTPDSGSIGSNASHGCIRMHMGDAEDLFERVEVGTPVLVVG